MRKKENSGFTCINCFKEVLPLTNGSYRNHCPFCLFSLHVDVSPGDRSNDCLGLMRPITYRKTSKKGYQLKHQCMKCKKEQWNIVAENTMQSDRFIEWVSENNFT